MVARAFGISLGYEDLIDDDQLLHDPVLATSPASSGEAPGLCPAGRKRRSTGSSRRLGIEPPHKIGDDPAAIESCSSASSSRRTRPRPRRSSSIGLRPMFLAWPPGRPLFYCTMTATAICRCTCLRPALLAASSGAED